MKHVMSCPRHQADGSSAGIFELDMEDARMSLGAYLDSDVHKQRYRRLVQVLFYVLTKLRVCPSLVSLRVQNTNRYEL